jgi:threonine/homoserine/homoserine lactone efflux protein
VWLGLQLWQDPPIRLAADTASPRAHGGALFRQGLLTAVSNPKGLLFYGAFLPQFIDPKSALWPQFIVMVTIFVAIEIMVEIMLARLAHRVRPWLESAGRRFNRVCGGLFVAMGVALPLTR